MTISNDKNVTIKNFFKLIFFGKNLFLKNLIILGLGFKKIQSSCNIIILHGQSFISN